MSIATCRGVSMPDASSRSYTFRLSISVSRISRLFKIKGLRMATYSFELFSAS